MTRLPTSYKPENRGRDNPDLRMMLTVLLHVAEDLDDDLGRRSDEDLTLALSLGVNDGLQAVVLYVDGDRDRDRSASRTSYAIVTQTKATFVGLFGNSRGRKRGPC